MGPNDANVMANSVEPDLTAPFRSSLLRTCTVYLDLYLDLSVPILRMAGEGTNLIWRDKNGHYIVILM